MYSLFNQKGVKSVESLRAQLYEAMEAKDRTMLDDLIYECVSVGMSELDADIHEARRVADIIRGGSGGAFET